MITTVGVVGVVVVAAPVVMLPTFVLAVVLVNTFVAPTAAPIVHSVAGVVTVRPAIAAPPPAICATCAAEKAVPPTDVTVKPPIDCVPDASVNACHVTVEVSVVVPVPSVVTSVGAVLGPGKPVEAPITISVTFVLTVVLVNVFVAPTAAPIVNSVAGVVTVRPAMAVPPPAICAT